MKSILAVFLFAVLASAASAAPQAKVEDCGWLVAQGDGLVAQPEPSLKPSDPAPLPKPPSGARAAYCERDTINTYLGDERLLALGLPLVIRSGGREGVLEVGPSALFNYHLVGKQYLPGRSSE
jgi:hypothetical protein